MVVTTGGVAFVIDEILDPREKVKVPALQVPDTVRVVLPSRVIVVEVTELTCCGPFMPVQFVEFTNTTSREFESSLGLQSDTVITKSVVESMLDIVQTWV